MDQKLKQIGGTLARVFFAAVLAQFIATGGDALSPSGDVVKTALSAGVSAVALAVFNFLNPRDSRYGIGS